MVGGTREGPPQDSKMNHRAASMLRTKENLLGRRSGAQDVQGKVCLDNPGVVIDRMTIYNGMSDLRGPLAYGMSRFAGSVGRQGKMCANIVGNVWNRVLARVGEQHR